MNKSILVTASSVALNCITFTITDTDIFYSTLKKVFSLVSWCLYSFLHTAWFLLNAVTGASKQNFCCIWRQSADGSYIWDSSFVENIFPWVKRKKRSMDFIDSSKPTLYIYSNKYKVLLGVMTATVHQQGVCGNHHIPLCFLFRYLKLCEVYLSYCFQGAFFLYKTLWNSPSCINIFDLKCFSVGKNLSWVPLIPSILKLSE